MSRVKAGAVQALKEEMERKMEEVRESNEKERKEIKETHEKEKKEIKETYEKEKKELKAHWEEDTKKKLASSEKDKQVSDNLRYKQAGFCAVNFDERILNAGQNRIILHFSHKKMYAIVL